MSSIRDVAKKANVAACTVSRVLNGSGYVSSETKAKIEKAMKELNYIPNELARGMFRQRSGIIAMLVPNIRHPFFSSLAHCIEQELFQVGYKLMLCSTGDNVKRESEYMQTLKSNIVDGVILGVNNLEYSEYVNYNKPLIMLDYKVNDRIPVVVSNHTQGGKLAAEEFIRSKCKNIIHICDSTVKEHLSHILSYNCHIALDDELKHHGIQSKNVSIRWNEFDFDGYLDMARTILEKYPTIDGVMAADMPAAAFLKAAVQIGKKIPEDFCVVAYDGTYVSSINLMDITTIVQPLKNIASCVIEVIMQLIEGQQPQKSFYEIDVHLKRGQTTSNKE